MHIVQFIYFSWNNYMSWYIYIEGYLSHYIGMKACSLSIPLFNVTNSFTMWLLHQSFVSAHHFTIWSKPVLWVYHLVYVVLYFSSLQLAQMTIFSLIPFLQMDFWLPYSLARKNRWYFKYIPWPISLLKLILRRLNDIYHC